MIPSSIYQPQARASRSPLSTLPSPPSRPPSQISHRPLLAVTPFHRPIQPRSTPRLTPMTPGISSLTTSRGGTSTKSTARGFCLVPRATASSCALLHPCGTSAPRRLAKNVESARQRYISLLACPRFGLKFGFSFHLSKCTGTRPSCARCASRDYICEYASEATSDSAAANPAITTKARRPSRRETREGPTILAQHHQDSSPPYPSQQPLGPNHCTIIKSEMPEFLSLHHFPDHTSSSYWEGSTPSDDCSMEEPWQFHHHEGSSIAAPHPVRGGHHSTHPWPQPLVMAPTQLPAHAGDAQAGASHAQIQLPVLPHFDVSSSQRLGEYEVYVQPDVKYEQSTAVSPSPHPYDS